MAYQIEQVDDRFDRIRHVVDNLQSSVGVLRPHWHSNRPKILQKSTLGFRQQIM